MSEGDEIKKPLGKGGQGCVKLVEHNGQRMARKEINVKKNGLEQCLKEVKMIEQLRDRHVLIFKEYYHDKEHDKFYIYTEYFRNRDLRRLIEKQNHKDFEIPIVIKYMKDLINVVKYIHSKNIIHRDLKPGNILVSDNNELVIGDLGLAVEKGMSHYGFGGTPNYIAPEIYENEENPPYSEASDIFALGCIFYEIYTLRMLYNGRDNKEIRDKILSNIVVSFERNDLDRNTLVENLIMKMLEKDPSKRLCLKRIEDRVNIIEEDLDISSVPNSTVSSFIPSSISASHPVAGKISTTYSSFAPSQQLNPIIAFYLHNASVANISLDDMCAMSQEQFKRIWKNDNINFMFPIIDQTNPPFTAKDALLLKNGKNEFEDKLQKLIQMINSLPDYYSSGIEDRIDLFLSVLELQFSFDEIDTVNNSKNSKTTTSTQLPPSSPPQSTMNFYLEDGAIESKSLNNMCRMSQEEFNQFWKYDYINMMFPVVGQTNPPFTLENAFVLMKRKNEFKDKLEKLLPLLRQLPEEMIISISERIDLFLASLELPYSFDGIESVNNSYNIKSTSSSAHPPPPSTSSSTNSSSTIPLTPSITKRKIPIYQRGGLHPSRWIHVTDVEIDNCPAQVQSLWYERPDEGNNLLSVNGEPPNYHPSGIVQGSEGLDYSFLNKIGYGNWWTKTKEEEYVYVPVYQREGHHPSKWIYQTTAPIKAEYKDKITCLYYARSNEGNELLSVIGVPSVYHLNGRQVEGSSGIPREYLNKISQAGWWNYTK